MPKYSAVAWEWAMKVQEVILRAMAKKITWWQAAEIIGISDRSMRRWRQRYEEYSYDGLLDRRRGKPSPQRVPLGQAEEVLRLYQEKYGDLNVRHFHEKLQEGHGIELSYTWVKLALQGAGLVKKGRNGACTASGGSGDPCRGCCCTWTAVGISGFRTSVGMT
jgi:transposase